MNLSANSDNPHENYTNLSQTFSKVVKKHAPLKKEILRGNHAPFIKREFRKDIYKRSRLRNKFLKDPAKENELLFKTQRSKCVSLRRKCIKSYFQDVTKKGLVTNKPFWNFVKPFLTYKSCNTHNDIMLIDNGKDIIEESDLVETFNDHYINIIEKSSVQKPCNFVLDTNSREDYVVINEIVQHYSNHPSILKVREKFENSQTVEQCEFNSVTTSEIYKLLKNIDDKKATGTDTIPPKRVKISAEVLSQPLADAINNSISKGVFPDNAKIASVSPIDKQSDDKKSLKF